MAVWQATLFYWTRANAYEKTPHIRLHFPFLLSSGAHRGGANYARRGIDYKSEQPVRTRHAMVVTVHHDATDAGFEILKQGGNAVDAAVAVGFALAVVHPEAGNIGGGGFMLVRFNNGKSHFMDYREEAPGTATMNMYLDAKGNVIPDASTVGYRSVGVPGSVAGMVRAEKLWGS